MARDTYVWPDPSGYGWVDAWNGWYETETQASEEGAAGDDAVWRETCDQHDTFQADHEPADVSDPHWNTHVLPPEYEMP